MRSATSSSTRPGSRRRPADERPFPTLAALYDRLSAALLGARAEQQLAVIKAHPDLAGKAARAGTLTAESTAEQASAGLDRLSDEDYATFHRLNEAYKQKFGFPFIIGVRRHTKDSILDQLDRRRSHDIEAERETALREILRIVALRLDQRVRAAGPASRSMAGSRPMCSTISPDARRQGVAIELFEVSKTDERRLVDPRRDQP